MVTGLETYKLFHAIRLHFIKENIDFFRLGGKIRVGDPYTFSTRRDRYFYDKVGKLCPTELELTNFFVAGWTVGENINKDPKKIWIAEFLEQKARDNYNEWKKQSNALVYQYQNDMATLYQNNEIPFLTPDNMPDALQKLVDSKISVTSICMADIITDGILLKTWARTYSNDPMLVDLITRIKKVKLFLPDISVSEQNQLRDIMVNNFTKDIGKA